MQRASGFFMGTRAGGLFQRPFFFTGPPAASWIGTRVAKLSASRCIVNGPLEPGFQSRSTVQFGVKNWICSQNLISTQMVTRRSKREQPFVWTCSICIVTSAASPSRLCSNQSDFRPKIPTTKTLSFTCHLAQGRATVLVNAFLFQTVIQIEIAYISENGRNSWAFVITFFWIVF